MLGVEDNEVGRCRGFVMVPSSCRRWWRRTYWSRGRRGWEGGWGWQPGRRGLLVNLWGIEACSLICGGGSRRGSSSAGMVARRQRLLLLRWWWQVLRWRWRLCWRRWARRVAVDLVREEAEGGETTNLYAFSRSASMGAALRVRLPVAH
jgi:hypothetical protein